MGKIGRFRANIERYGTKWALSSAATSAMRRLGLFSELQLIKERTQHEARRTFGGTVAYGPFKGMRLGEDIWWGPYDVASKLVGEYEPQVLNTLVELSGKSPYFIDIGAADGYYAVGSLVGGLYDKAICFEISVKGQRVIAENAALNGVSDRIAVHGLADAGSLREIVAANGPAVVLCDIEGAEFALLDDEVLGVLSQCHVLVELHDGFVRGDPDRRAELFRRAQKHFDIEPIERAIPKVHAFPEFDTIDDDGRLLIFSENRPVKMEWVLLQPKA